jgi:hypothetical protein
MNTLRRLYIYLFNSLYHYVTEEKVQTVLLQRDGCVLVRPRVIENNVIKIGSCKKKKFGPSSNLASSHWSLQLLNSQHAYAKFRADKERSAIH